MKNLNKALTSSEQDWIDSFLLNRMAEDEDVEGKDEGILGISELDGYFTAIVSGPEMVVPSLWLPQVWGDFELEWESEKEFEKVVNLFMRHMNSIASILIENPSYLEPIFMESKVSGRKNTIVEDWCYGYMRGVTLCLEDWDIEQLDMRILLSPILAFGSEHGCDTLSEMSSDEIKNIKSAIIPNVHEIYSYWLARRDSPGSGNKPTVRAAPRIGRNDPCPCGSGKKFKKCCLH